MSVSADGDQMVILSFLSSYDTFACNTTYVSASSWEDVKEDIRLKLNFQILLFWHLKTE